jgi:hypothetical protein
MNIPTTFTHLACRTTRPYASPLQGRSPVMPIIAVDDVPARGGGGSAKPS